jgi:membrane protease YdiL (CAAX protease family)
MHLVNPDATLWGATAIAIEAGFMLAACYAATRNLWVPIGLHFGWNFALGGISGATVSGNGESKGLLDATFSGSTLVTGGDFGPEGSLYTLAAGVALTVVFMWLAHRRGHIVPRRRSAAGDPAATATVSR